MLNTYYNYRTKKTMRVTGIDCYTIDEENDVLITDPKIIADYCQSQMGDEFDFMGFIERLNQAGYEYESAIVQETA